MRRLAFFGLLTGLMFSNMALAYVPPSAFIVKSVAAKHTVLKSGLRIRATVTGLDPSKPADLRFKTVLSFDAKTAHLRAWALNQDDKTLFVIDRTLADLPLAGAIALSPSGPALESLLLANGVPIKTETELLALPDEASRLRAERTALKRWKTYFAWTIGKESPSESEFWVEKDTFLPLRLVFSKTTNPLLSELQIAGYKYQQGFGFPLATTVVLRSGTPFLREELSDLWVGNVANDFKDPLATPGFTPLGDEAPKALKELIETYFRVLR